MQGNREKLIKLLSFVTEDASVMAGKLLERFGSLEAVLSADLNELAQITENRRTALLLKLTAGIQARRLTDQFSFSAKHTEDEIKSYFEALFFGLAKERVYMMSFDSHGRAVDCRAVGDGTVNAAGVLPRALLEIAISNKAASVILAHNHPSGDSSASTEDINMTVSLYEMFFDGGIKLVEHYIVSSNECRAMQVSKLLGYDQNTV